MAKTETPNTERRKAQLAELHEIVEQVLVPHVQAQRAAEAQSGLLASVAAGLYAELDKLSKKAPTEPITDLMLEQINDLIREVKTLISDDAFVQKLKEFVPAGDNPEQRDALVVCRMLREGLTRFAPTLKKWRERGGAKLHEAKVVRWATHVYVTENRAVEAEEVDRVSVASGWFRDNGRFDVKKLDSVNLREYFQP